MKNLVIISILFSFCSQFSAVATPFDTTFTNDSRVKSLVHFEVRDANDMVISAGHLLNGKKEGRIPELQCQGYYYLGSGIS
jgi:hypothetical protein